MSKLRRGLKWLAIGAAFFVAAVVVILFPSNQDVKHMAANEMSALLRLRTIADRQSAYRSAHDGSFADALGPLDMPTEGMGYLYSLQVTRKDSDGRVVRYSVDASPKIPGKTGKRYFSMDETGKIRSEENHPVDEHASALQ